MSDQCWCGGAAYDVTDFSDAFRVRRCIASAFHDPDATGEPEVVTRLYVAGPMSGYPECNYPAFNRAAEALREAGYEVVNPVEVSAGQNAHYVDYLREDLRAMLDCHAVATLEGWWASSGARNEVNVAGLLKFQVRPVSEWLAHPLPVEPEESPAHPVPGR